MKFLSALVLSFGLTTAVFADEKLDKARWVQSLTGLFSRTCSEFNTGVKVDVDMARQKMSPHFTSFVMGYNLALKDVYTVIKQENLLPNEVIVPYLDITSLVEKERDILFDTVSVRCRMEPERAVIAVLSEWMTQQQIDQLTKEQN